MSSTYSRVVFLCCWSLLCTSAYSAQGEPFEVQGISLAKLLEKNPNNITEAVTIDTAASFLEFLLYRAEKKEHAYTHVLGMGCSKKHCQECGALLKLFLGSKYETVTSATVKSSQEKVDFTVAHASESGNEVHFEIKYAEDAIRTKEKLSKKFLLSDGLKGHIKSKYGLHSLPIDMERFCDRTEKRLVNDTKPPAAKRQKTVT